MVTKIDNYPLVLMKQKHGVDFTYKIGEKPIILKHIENGTISVRCGRVYRRVNSLDTSYQGEKGSGIQLLVVKLFDTGLICCDSKGKLHLTEPGRWLLSVIEARELSFKRKIKQLKDKCK